MRFWPINRGKREDARKIQSDGAWFRTERNFMLEAESSRTSPWRNRGMLVGIAVIGQVQLALAPLANTNS